MSTNVKDDTLVSNKRESQSTTSKLTDTNVHIHSVPKKRHRLIPAVTVSRNIEIG